MLKLHNIDARAVTLYADAHASDEFLTDDECCTLSYEDCLFRVDETVSTIWRD